MQSEKKFQNDEERDLWTNCIITLLHDHANLVTHDLTAVADLLVADFRSRYWWDEEDSQSTMPDQ